jgi:hypothetical protein
MTNPPNYSDLRGEAWLANLLKNLEAEKKKGA